MPTPDDLDAIAARAEEAKRLSKVGCPSDFQIGVRLGECRDLITQLAADNAALVSRVRTAEAERDGIDAMFKTTVAEHQRQKEAARATESRQRELDSAACAKLIADNASLRRMVRELATHCDDHDLLDRAAELLAAPTKETP